MFEDKSFDVHSPPFIEVVKISRFKDIFSFKPYFKVSNAY